MALDYNQKKQVNKNRPRKRPVKLLLLLIIGSIVSLYGLGIATGWLVFKYLPRNSPPSLAGSAKQEKADQALPSSAQTAAKIGTSAPGKEPDLTFYYTLPKGDKGVIGSGINNLPPQTTPKNIPPALDKPAQQLQQSAEKMDPATPAAQREKVENNSGATNPSSGIKNTGKTTYTVQVAAYNKKSDAQELKAKLQKIGISSRIEEYTVPGKGIWYRVRSGSKLDKDAANKVAAKFGNTTILVAE
ncbi:MAG: SPOR domain-containing protein [Geobacteraceae bacterium]